MKFGAVLYAVALSTSLLVNGHAQGGGPDDLYLRAYELIQSGDELVRTGQAQLARDRYTEAESSLKKIQVTYPNYSKAAVEFRLEYLAERIKTLPAPQPAEPTGPTAGTAVTPPGRETDAKALQEQIQALQAEKSLLQAKLQEALAPKPAAADPAEFAKAQERIQQLEKEKELLRVRAEQSQAKAPQAADTALLEQMRGELEATKKQLVQNVGAVATLTQERNALLREKTELEEELARVSPGKRTGATADGTDLAGLREEVASLRARLGVYEAKKVPFTPEELALMKKDVPNLAASIDATPTRTAPRPLPPGAGLLITEGDRLFAQGRLEEAEEKYQQVLKMDEGHPASLANIAAIQLHMKKNVEAEANLKKALELNPQYGYALSLLGILYLQQDKVDEALDALSRSAQIDPKNAETQNYLGIALSQRGQREAAETALRTAITLNPNYAGAHHNLAVIYATQKPPFLELARFHYNKARTLGQAGNPEFEKQIGL